ncbi:MAG: hypothetical protein R3C13_12955 [Hyphomonas sp.]|uniref:hypothetical protein n=1 Tax=Hyphomonas sp. TaxID=87 RepID=UPI003528D09C
MSQTAYLMSCEVECGEGSDGALEGMEYAHVMVAVYAASDEEAMEKIEASFDDEGYAITDVDFFMEASDVEWSDAEGEAEGKDMLARLATIPEDVVYGHLYEVEFEEEEYSDEEEEYSDEDEEIEEAA